MDDVINVSGNRMATAEIEAAFNIHPQVAESAVVGMPHDIKGAAIYVYCILKDGDANSEEQLNEIIKSLIKYILQEIGPVASPEVIQFTPELPKTRSGKIMRRILRKTPAFDYDNFGDIFILLNPNIIYYIINNKSMKNYIMNSSIKDYVKIILALVFWASIYHIAPLTLKYVDIYLVGLIRYILASIIFLAIHYYFVGFFIPKLNVRQWLHIVVVGFFGVFLYNITFLWAEKLISGNIVAIIYAFTPCLITILSSYIFKMKVNQQAKAGILVALLGTIGVVMFSSGGDMSQCLNHIDINFGEVLSLLAVVCFAAYAILSKCCVKEGIHMITINTYGAIVGMIMFAIVSLFESDFSALANTDLEFWGSIIYIAVFATVIAYVWFLGALEEIGFYKTAVFQNLLPFLVILIGFIFFGETISILALLFGGVVFLGVYLTNAAVNKK